jgi:hypothetical protein
MLYDIARAWYAMSSVKRRESNVEVAEMFGLSEITL